MVVWYSVAITCEDVSSTLITAVCYYISLCLQELCDNANNTGMTSFDVITMQCIHCPYSTM